MPGVRNRIGWLGDTPLDPPKPEAPRRPSPSSHDPRFPGWTREGDYLYRRRQSFEGRGVEVWPEPFSPEAGRADELVFYDTETTGLSGGAGSVIFLFGAAWCEGRDLVVEQLFLSDFPGEPDFLLAVKEVLARFAAFVSYNGKTFDSHLLRTRFLMNRIPWEPGPQVDLLHHSRRLWKKLLGDCSLKSIEAGILGITREMDVAGEEIPVIWLEFLRSGLPGALHAVFDHNVMDIVSLARVHAVIGRVLGGDPGAVPLDERALGAWLLGRVPAAGTAVLAGAFERGNPDAGLALSLHHKRAGDRDKAVAIWRSMLEKGPSLLAGTELAKHLEHCERDPRGALELVETMLSWNLPLDRRQRDELQVRLVRLRRKSARPGGSGARKTAQP